MFHTADKDEVVKGKITDVYFARTKKILLEKDIHKKVKAEFTVKKLPQNYDWGVLAGVEECADLLEALANVHVETMPEGTIFYPGQPVMEIEGDYTDFGMFETSLLGLLCQASGIATKAARCRKLAQEKMMVSFGARRMHPVLAPMIERNAYIGGCDGVSVIKSAELLGINPTGTIPHALILIVGDAVEATKLFDEVIEPKVKRVALVDTFEDERFATEKIAKELGKKLFGVRLDTPTSRKGDLGEILKEIKWELNLRGYKDVKLFVSGGIDEDSISKLRESADAFGIGTAISNAPVLDFAMDIVEIEGEPVSKRGKTSGSKCVYRCPNCHKSVTVPEMAGEIETVCDCGEDYEDLLKPLVINENLVRDLPSADKIRNYVLEQLKKVDIKKDK